MTIDPPPDKTQLYLTLAILGTILWVAACFSVIRWYLDELARRQIDIADSLAALGRLPAGRGADPRAPHGTLDLSPEYAGSAEPAEDQNSNQAFRADEG